LEILLFLVTMVCTHLIISFCQTVLHWQMGHRRLGGLFFRNHINFHHTYYARGHLASAKYQGQEGNNTPFFLIPVFLVGSAVFFVLPFDLFLAVVLAAAASFSAHVYFDKAYHVQGSRFERYAWFRRRQQLHFVHHLHANSNFAVIDFFWDRLFGTFRRPEA
jgi:sterol desaturase/sphingolipid hydroxylase (fatty acid hydroxylase superfamily)